MPSIHSSDIDTVNNLRGSSLPLLPLWSRLQSCLIQRLASLQHKAIKGSRWKRERQHLKWQATPHVVTYITFTAIWPPGSTVVHYMEITVWCLRDQSPVRLLRWGSALASICHIWWLIVATLSEVTMCRRWPRESVRPLLKCRCCCPPRSRRWNTSLCQWMMTRVLPFAFL